MTVVIFTVFISLLYNKNIFGLLTSLYSEHFIDVIDKDIIKYLSVCVVLI